MDLTAEETEQLRKAISEASQPGAVPPWLATLLPILLKLLASILGGLIPPPPPPPGGRT